MKLSLSVRIAESSTRKDRAEMPLAELAPLARAAGFEGLSMRASQLSIDTPPDEVAAARSLLDHHGLAVSMITGNVAVAANNTQAPAALREIGRHLDLAGRLGCRLVRIALQQEDDIAACRAAADAAAERGVTLAFQPHWGTLAETTEEALALVSRIARRNVGITFEPANLLGAGDDAGPAAIARLAPHLVNVYLSSIRFHDAGEHRFPTRSRGEQRLSYVALDDPSGVAMAPLIGALRAAGYDGWITSHQPLRPGQTVQEAIAEAARALVPLMRATAPATP
jgi:sugar phosphate isomerase/epimerase